MSSCEDYRKIYRSDEDRVIAGVCGGIGEYFRIDPVIIRLLWIVSLFAGGTGFFAYLIAWLIIPPKPYVN